MFINFIMVVIQNFMTKIIQNLSASSNSPLQQAIYVTITYM